MFDFQGLIFRNAAHWSTATSLVVFLLGLLFTLQGFRFARVLLPLTCAAGGLVVGMLACGLADLPAGVSFLFAAVFGIIGLLRYRLAVIASSAFAFAVLLQYLAYQFGIRHNESLIVGAVGFTLGIGMFWLYRLQLPMIVTIIVGGGLSITGFVGLSASLVPSLGLTFIEWANELSLMTPLMNLMMWTLGYAVQANAKQGAIQTGGSPDIQGLSI